MQFPERSYIIAFALFNKAHKLCAISSAGRAEPLIAHLKSLILRTLEPRGRRFFSCSNEQRVRKDATTGECLHSSGRWRLFLHAANAATEMKRKARNRGWRCEWTKPCGECRDRCLNTWRGICEPSVKVHRVDEAQSAESRLALLSVGFTADIRCVKI